MDQIEPDALYDQRTDVSRARPLLQGDVFDGVVLPGFGEEPMKVQIVSHPCAMRTGANLTPHITVAPVEPYQAVTGKGWDGNLRVMPLGGLVESENFATRFVDVTAAPAELLTRARRIATLSHQGIYVLQQRLIKHYTRVEMPLELLRSESAAVLTEAGLQWDWLEEVLTGAELVEEPAAPLVDAHDPASVVLSRLAQEPRSEGPLPWLAGLPQQVRDHPTWARTWRPACSRSATSPPSWSARAMPSSRLRGLARTCVTGNSSTS